MKMAMWRREVDALADRLIGRSMSRQLKFQPALRADLRLAGLLCRHLLSRLPDDPFEVEETPRDYGGST
jgi:hypothetical protein